MVAQMCPRTETGSALGVDVVTPQQFAEMIAVHAGGTCRRRDAARVLRDQRTEVGALEASHHLVLRPTEG